MNKNTTGKMVREMFGENDQEHAQDDGHTPAFRQFKNLLTWTSYKFQDYRPVQMTMFSKPELSIEDKRNLYFMTRYIRDDEMAMINGERTRQGLAPLPRLSYAGGGEYIEVADQRARHFAETNAMVGVKIPSGGVPALVAKAQGHVEF